MPISEYVKDVFGPINNPDIFVANKPQFITNKINRYLQGFNDEGKEFGFMAKFGAAFDNDDVIFFANATEKHKVPVDLNLKIKKAGGSNAFSLDNLYFKHTHDLELVPQKINLSGGGGSVNTFDIIASRNLGNFSFGVMLLCLHKGEFEALRDLNTSAFHAKYNRYINLEKVLEPGENFSSMDNNMTVYHKYKLFVSGKNTIGEDHDEVPTPSIFVYSTDRMVFSSPNFGGFTVPVPGSSYTRNYEENIGLKEKEPGLTYEDYFIELNTDIRDIVNAFISAMNNVTNDANALTNIIALISEKASALWAQAVTSVKANNYANPDDRSLYWARNKMEVALKSHPNFEIDFDPLTFIVKPHTDLEKMITLFEEKSRNYRGINFSNVPTGVKKILITGYDPFQLNYRKPDHDINHNNPSGSIALALNNCEIKSDPYNNTGTTVAIVQSYVLPVRYKDFDNGLDIDLFYDIIQNNKADIIITFSLTPDGNYFDIDRFAARYRGGYIDNAGISNPNQLPAFDDFKPFYETILPFVKIIYYQSISIFTIRLNQIYFDVNNDEQDANYIVNTDILNPESYYLNPPTLDQNIEIKGGSGQNYLSNEIFYRVSRIRKKLNPNMPTGHIHVPGRPLDGTTVLTVTDIINQVKDILKNTAI